MCTRCINVPQTTLREKLQSSLLSYKFPTCHQSLSCCNASDVSPTFHTFHPYGGEFMRYANQDGGCGTMVSLCGAGVIIIRVLTFALPAIPPFDFPGTRIAASHISTLAPPPPQAALQPHQGVTWQATNITFMYIVRNLHVYKKRGKKMPFTILRCLNNKGTSF